MRDVPAPESLLVVEMPLLAGNLAQHIANFGAVPFGNVLAILRSVGGALDEAHAAGIIHGGLQPSKILLSRDERAFISDFAIRVPQQADWDVSRPSEAGSLPYMPLEQRHDSPNMDGRIDQYSLAIIAYELLRGHPTWRYSVDGGVQIDPIEVIVHRPVVEGAPIGAGSAIKRAISKDPAFRFVSAGEFVRSFSGAGEERVVAEQTHHEERVVERRRFRLAWVVLPLALGVLAAAAIPQIRYAAIDTLSSLLPSRNRSEESAFQIDTTAAPGDTTPAAKNANKKAAPDAAKRKRGASGDVTTIPEFEESVLMIAVDGGGSGTVLVDGHARGQSPVTVKVPAGQHQVSVRGAVRFSPSSVTIIVASGDTEGEVQGGEPVIRRGGLLHLDDEVVDVAVDPILAGLQRLDQRVGRTSPVTSRVLVLRGVTAADVAARQTRPKVHPVVAEGDALVADVGRRFDHNYGSDVRALGTGCHRPLRYS